MIHHHHHPKYIQKRSPERETPLLLPNPAFSIEFFSLFSSQSFFLFEGGDTPLYQALLITSSHSTTGQSSTTTHRATVVKKKFQR